MIQQEFVIHLRQPHPRQREFIETVAKRKIIRAGRRSGKTVGVSILAVKGFLAGRRVLYAVPTQEQAVRFWFEVKRALAEPIDAGVFYKNEVEHIVEIPNSLQRIRAKTAWDAETLRGDYADLLIIDEFQLCNEDAWELVGAPMLLDNDGDAVFIYTPPSIRTRSMSKARDKLHAAKLFKRAAADVTGRWATFHFASHANPYISADALKEITSDMSRLAYEQEILAEDKEDNPHAIWKREDIENNRVKELPALERIVVGVDPSITATGDEAGIIVNGKFENHLYTLEDLSIQTSPKKWAEIAVTAYWKWHANTICAEMNQGGEMVAETIHQIDSRVPVRLIHVKQGKSVRAEPIATIYEQGRGHHVGVFGELEDQMCMWESGMESPDRMDAHVLGATELMLNQGQAVGAEKNIEAKRGRWTDGTEGGRWRRR